MKPRAPRFIDEAYPVRKDANGKRVCSFCHGPLPANARGNQKYCSKKCTDEVYVRCLPGYARSFVRDRDKGVCAICGCDTEKIERIFRYVWRHVGWQERGHAKRTLGFTTRHYWEVDHIRPVIDGGGLCGPENLRTLCIPCHHEESRQLARRRAKDRKKMPLFAKRNQT